MIDRYSKQADFMFCHDNSNYDQTVVFFSGLGQLIESQHVEEYRKFCRDTHVSFIALDSTAHAFTHINDSDGRFGLSHKLTDTLDILKQEVPNQPLILLGFSMGGKLSLNVAEILQVQTKALIELAPAVELGQHDWFGHLREMSKRKYAFLQRSEPFSSKVSNFNLFDKMMDAVEREVLLTKPVDYIGPTTIIHGTSDKHVPVENSQMFRKNYMPHAKLIEIPFENHNFLQKSSRKIVLDALLKNLQNVRGK